MRKKMERKHYKAIDGLRTIACIGIVMMHVRANTTYDIQVLLSVVLIIPVLIINKWFPFIMGRRRAKTI